MRAALIGYGYWGPNLARNLWSSSRAELVVACDLSSERRQVAAQTFPGVETLEDWEAAVRRPDIDSVFVATPVSTHFEIAAAALTAGKHTFVEKPLTGSVASSKQLLEKARAGNRVLMVDYPFLFTGAVRKLKELLATDELGDLLYFDSLRVNLGLVQPDVDVLWDLALHDLSILDFLVDRTPTAVSATGSIQPPSTQHSTAFLTLFFDDTFIAHIDVGWMSPVKVRRTLLAGTQKMVVYDDLEPSEKIKVYDSGVKATTNDRRETLVSYRIGDMVAPRLEQKEALAAEIEYFIDCVDQGKEPVNSGQAGLRIVSILEAASASLKLRGAPLELGEIQ